MKRRNFIKTTGLGLAVITSNCSNIFATNGFTKIKLNIVVLLSGGVNFNDIVKNDNNNNSICFDSNFQGKIICHNKVKYTGNIMEHADALLAALQPFKSNPHQQIFIGNQYAESTNCILNSNIPLEIHAVSPLTIDKPYNADAAVFEKAFQNLNPLNDTTIILNLEDTDVAHYSYEKYLEVLSYYSLQLNKISAIIFNESNNQNYQCTLTVASVLGRNGFANDIESENFSYCTDHYHENARNLFLLSYQKSSQKTLIFDETPLDSSEFFKASINVPI
ncbi:MAG TPA: hypothetical protein PK323_08040 [Bacteroidia bacterium]|nr:hypothetical protein [Bacteroidia bacterium]